MSSKLVKTPPEDMDGTPPSIESLMENRYYNSRFYENSKLPVAKRALVIGAGDSLTDAVLNSVGMYDLFIEYDAVLVTYPMADHLKYRIIGLTKMYVVDAEFFDMSYYYGSFMKAVWLICPWEKDMRETVECKICDGDTWDLTGDWDKQDILEKCPDCKGTGKSEQPQNVHKVTFLSPKGEMDFEERHRIAPNYPKSTGAVALQVALEDMGGETIVDVIGIDCTGKGYVKYREETLKVIDRHRDRVNLINCGIGD